MKLKDLSPKDILIKENQLFFSIKVKQNKGAKLEDPVSVNSSDFYEKSSAIFFQKCHETAMSGN